MQVHQPLVVGPAGVHAGKSLGAADACDIKGLILALPLLRCALVVQHSPCGCKGEQHEWKTGGGVAEALAYIRCAAPPPHALPHARLRDATRTVSGNQGNREGGGPYIEKRRSREGGEVGRGRRGGGGWGARRQHWRNTGRGGGLERRQHTSAATPAAGREAKRRDKQVGRWG